MKRTLTASLAALLLAALAGSGATPASQSTGVAKTAWDDYRLILSRNIFSRTRTAPGREGRGGFVRPTRTTAESFLVLRGVGMQDELRIAFVEDTRSGQSYRVAAGKSLGGGVIRSVSLDGVEYVLNGASRTVNIGETLTGVPAGSVASSSQPATAGAGLAAATSQAAPPASGPSSVNDLIERMRQRRLQETK
jgi:hypothetical protein